MVARRHLGEQLDALEGAAHPQPGPAVDGSRELGAEVEPGKIEDDRVEVLTGEGDRAGVGAEDPEQAVEQGGLAGPVGPDQADRLTGLDAERQLVQRLEECHLRIRPAGANAREAMGRRGRAACGRRQ